MSSTTTPISLARFAAALPALPLSSLHAKVAELQNSILHLQASNSELQPFAEEGDRECAEAVEENRVVIGRMEERIGLLRREVEGRGLLWERGEGGDGDGQEGDGDVEMVNGDAVQRLEERGGERGGEGERQGIGDEEIRRLRQMMEADDNDGEDGLHL